MYIIADACNNFNGDIETAKRLIDCAEEAQCDAIKFQLRYQEDRIGEKELLELKEYTDRTHLDFLCTPFSLRAVDFLEPLVKKFKIASGDLNNYDLIAKVMECNKPVIISTGMSTVYEIVESINYMEKSNVDLTVLQCSSIYPTPFNRINLGFLLGCQINHRMGLSSHCPSIYPSIAAIALGASVIEHHITLDRNQEGPDHSSSLLPEEFRELVKGCHQVLLSLGDEKRIFPEEKEKLKYKK